MTYLLNHLLKHHLQNDLGKTMHPQNRRNSRLQNAQEDHQNLKLKTISALS